jgi:hypothetical protein
MIWNPEVKKNDTNLCPNDFLILRIGGRRIFHQHFVWGVEINNMAMSEEEDFKPIPRD